MIATGGKVLFSTVVSSPSTLNAAKALAEIDLLGEYYTTLGLRSGGLTLRLARSLDSVFDLNLTSQLQRRETAGIPDALVRKFPLWDAVRTILSRSGFDEARMDQVTVAGLDAFDRHVARRVADQRAVYAFNGAASRTFIAAKARGVPCIYGVKSPDVRFLEAVYHGELNKYPFLRSGDSVLAGVGVRPAVWQAEWAMADLVIANSQFTLESFAANGLDIAKGRVVTLAFPPTRYADRFPADPTGPLRVLWAGSFSIRKGAHYLLQALARMGSSKVDVRVLGKQALPQAALETWPAKISLRGTVPMSELLLEYGRADLLVLPTLSDGFGMVVSEAMSQGCAVITTERAGVSQFIEHGRNGLIVPAGDADALAAALEWCAANREALAQMGAEGRRTAMTWQWSDYRAALAATVKEALDVVH